MNNVYRPYSVPANTVTNGVDGIAVVFLNDEGLAHWNDPVPSCPACHSEDRAVKKLEYGCRGATDYHPCCDPYKWHAGALSGPRAYQPEPFHFKTPATQRANDVPPRDGEGGGA